MCQIEDTPLPHNLLVLLWTSRFQAPWELKHRFPSILHELVLLLLISLCYYYLISSIISSQSAWNAAEPKEHFTVLHYAQVLRLLGFSSFKFMDADSLQPLNSVYHSKITHCCRQLMLQTSEADWISRKDRVNHVHTLQCLAWCWSLNVLWLSHSEHTDQFPEFWMCNALVKFYWKEILPLQRTPWGWMLWWVAW